MEMEPSYTNTNSDNFLLPVTVDYFIKRIDVQKPPRKDTEYKARIIMSVSHEECSSFRRREVASFIPNVDMRTILGLNVNNMLLELLLELSDSFQSNPSHRKIDVPEAFLIFLENKDGKEIYLNELNTSNIFYILGTLNEKQEKEVVVKTYTVDNFLLGGIVDNECISYPGTPHCRHRVQRQCEDTKDNFTVEYLGANQILEYHTHLLDPIRNEEFLKLHPPPKLYTIDEPYFDRSRDSKIVVSHECDNTRAPKDCIHKVRVYDVYGRLIAILDRTWAQIRSYYYSSVVGTSFSSHFSSSKEVKLT